MIDKCTTKTFIKFGANNTKLILHCIDNEIINNSLTFYNKLSTETKTEFKEVAHNSLKYTDPRRFGNRWPTPNPCTRTNDRVKP